MTTSTVEQTSTPQVAVNDIGTAEDFLAAIDETIKYFNDGDIVEGTIVKVDRDEVLLDIGYKTEGVIPSRELSIKHDVDPSEVVTVGDEVEALVLQKEDKEGRLILSKKRAQYERAWGTIEKIKEEDGVVTGTVIEVVKGGLILDIGLRGFLPASLVEMRRVRDLQPYVGKQIEAKIIELDKNRNNVVLSRRAWLEQTQSEVRQTFLHDAAEGPGPLRRRLLDRQLRCVRRPRRRRRSGARLRAVLEAHRPPERGRRGRPGGHRRGARRRHGPRARLAVAQGDAGRPVAAVRPHPRDRPGRAGQGHQAGAVRRVRPRRRGHRGPGAHLRAGRAPRRDPRAGRPGRRRASSSRSSTSTSSVAGSRCRSSRPTRASRRPATEFDPTLYGMAAEYDEQGNYKYPEGFDPETNEWLPGLRDASARSGSSSTPRPTPAGRPTRSRSTRPEGRRPRAAEARGRTPARGRRRGHAGVRRALAACARSSGSSSRAPRPAERRRLASRRGPAPASAGRSSTGGF